MEEVKEDSQETDETKKIETEAQEIIQYETKRNIQRRVRRK